MRWVLLGAIGVTACATRARPIAIEEVASALSNVRRLERTHREEAERAALRRDDLGPGRYRDLLGRALSLERERLKREREARELAVVFDAAEVVARAGAGTAGLGLPAFLADALATGDPGATGAAVARRARTVASRLRALILDLGAVTTEVVELRGRVVALQRRAGELRSLLAGLVPALSIPFDADALLRELRVHASGCGLIVARFGPASGEARRLPTAIHEVVMDVTLLGEAAGIGPWMARAVPGWSGRPGLGLDALTAEAAPGAQSRARIRIRSVHAGKAMSVAPLPLTSSLDLLRTLVSEYETWWSALSSARASAKEIRRMYDTVVEAMPYAARLTALEMTPERMAADGEAVTEEAVSRLRGALAAMPGFGDVRVEPRAGIADGRIRFALIAAWKQPDAPARAPVAHGSPPARRDPFSFVAANPLVAAAPPGVAARRSEPPSERALPFQAYRLVGILRVAGTEPRAMVVGPSGETHAVRVGDALPGGGGRVAEIRPDGISVILRDPATGSWRRETLPWSGGGGAPGIATQPGLRPAPTLARVPDAGRRPAPAREEEEPPPEIIPEERRRPR